MRRALLIVLAALTAGACGAAPYQSDDYAAVEVAPGVVLWRLASSGAGFVAIGGAFDPADLEDGAGALALFAYTSPDGVVWTEAAALGTVGRPQVGLAVFEGGMAASGIWDGDPAVLVSGDGSAWRRVDLPGAGGVLALEPAGLAGHGGVVVVAGAGAGDAGPPLWRIADGRAAKVDTSPFGEGARITQVASGPAGFVAAAAGAARPAFASPDGTAWAPVAAEFGEGAVITGLVGGPDGFVAVVALPGQEDASRLWVSADGNAWHLRADQDSVFRHLRGTWGSLYDDLAAPAAEASPTRPIAFAFDGTWLEVVEAYEGRRFLAVSVAVSDGIRLVSGFTGRDDPIPVLLRAGG